MNWIEELLRCALAVMLAIVAGFVAWELIEWWGL